MTDLRNAAEMALKFCEDIEDLDGPYPYVNKTAIVSDSRKVLQALRQALAEPANSTTDFVEPKASSQTEQKPVAWLIQYKTRHDIVWGSTPGLRNNDKILGMEPFYTAPPKREWVGLTDEEYDELMLSGDWGGSLIQAVEAKLKEKNT